MNAVIGPEINSEDNNMTADNDYNGPDVTLKRLDNSTSADAEDFSVAYFYAEDRPQMTKSGNKRDDATTNYTEKHHKKPNKHKLVKF